jgi:hypothetical protein
VWLANEVRIWGLAITAILGAVSFVATWTHSRWQAELSGQREAQAKEIQRASDERIAVAQADAANANERAASLANEASQARLEQEKLKAQLAWRVLSPQSTATIEQRLSQQPASINIEHVANDPEALYLAIQVANIFGKANWQVAMNAVTMSGTAVFGIWIPHFDSPAALVVREAFTAAGIGFSTDVPPPAGMGFGGSIQGAPRLLIGSKRPPP